MRKLEKLERKRERETRNRRGGVLDFARFVIYARIESVYIRERRGIRSRERGIADKEKFSRFPRFISWTGTLFPGVRSGDAELLPPEREKTYPYESGRLHPRPINLFRILLNAPTFRSAINRFLCRFPANSWRYWHRPPYISPTHQRVSILPVAQKRHFISTFQPRCYRVSETFSLNGI